MKAPRKVTYTLESEGFLLAKSGIELPIRGFSIRTEQREQANSIAMLVRDNQGAVS